MTPMSNEIRSIPDEDLQPISALNDLLFCERRCALHRIENVWADNAHTLEGLHDHQRADRPGYETGDGFVTVRGVLLRSQRHGLIGKADVVEFWGETPFPVEYKRGRRKKWDNDDVQLCAQALCLEEMLGVTVSAGAIFHIKSKRRREVTFTLDLRSKTEAAARRLHELIASRVTPPPMLKSRCQGCSLREMCLPSCLQDHARVRRYVAALYSVEPDSTIAERL